MDKYRGATRRYCHAQLPNAGLGNKLFVWARALVFARVNGLPLVVTGWLKFQKAPILAAGDWRFYWNYFEPVSEVSLLQRVAMKGGARIVKNADIHQVPSTGDCQPVIFEFREIPPWQEHFQELKPHREMIRDALLSLLTPARRREYADAPKPVVCVHVRMSDFRSLRRGENFAKVGSVRTPLAYFAQLITGIRTLHGSQLPVQLFSDGDPADLQELLQLPNVELAPRRSAIVDMLLMANSKVLIPSAGSTFGYWAGFLGDGALLIHPDHVHKTIRPDSVNQKYYEGPAQGSPDQWAELLRANIATIYGKV